MSADLPNTVDVRQFADNGHRLQGALDGSLCCRLDALVEYYEGNIQVDLQFQRDTWDRQVITGTIIVMVVANCQRCLEEVPYELRCGVALGVVKNEAQAKLLPGSLEPIFGGDGPIDLVGLVEDELLLALPSVITHEECEAPLQLRQPAVAQEKRNNPFAMLKS